MIKYAICLYALIMPLLSHADAFVCVENGKKTISNIPCPETSTTAKTVVGDRVPVRQSERPVDNMQRQLRNMENMRNGSGGNTKSSKGSGQQSKVTSIEERDANGKTKQENCQRNWRDLENVKAQARQQSTDYLRKRERELSDERWKLDC